MSGGPKRIAAVLAAVLVVALAAGPARRDAVHAQEGTGRVFALKHSATSRVGAVYELTGGAAVEFARLRTGGWVGALAASPDGRLYAVTDAEDGSLWDVSDGGDLTRAQPKARGLFARTIGLSDTVRGLTFDGDGNAYVLYRHWVDASPIVKVTPDGAVSELPIRLEDPRGLLAHRGVLYVADYDSGQVLAYDLASGDPRVFATGFGRSMAQGVRQIEVPELAVDAAGRLLVLWDTVNPGAIATFCCNEPALYDITDGGDFSGLKGGLALAPQRQMRVGPDGPIAIGGDDSVYAGSDTPDGTVYVSRFVDGAYMPFEALAAVPGGRADRITGLAVLR